MDRDGQGDTESLVTVRQAKSEYCEVSKNSHDLILINVLKIDEY